MNGYYRLALIVVLAAVVLISGSFPARADTTLKFRAVAYISDVKLIKVQDDEKHVMGVYEHQGVVLFEDGKAAAFLDRGGFDMYEPNGSHFGYSRITFTDGSIIDFKYEGEEYIKPGEELPSVKGQGTFISGTGRFKGIKGTLTYGGGYVTPFDEETNSLGDSVIDYEAVYSLGD